MRQNRVGRRWASPGGRFYVTTVPDIAQHGRQQGIKTKGGGKAQRGWRSVKGDGGSQAPGPVFEAAQGSSRASERSEFRTSASSPGLLRIPGPLRILRSGCHKSQCLRAIELAI